MSVSGVPDEERARMVPIVQAWLEAKDKSERYNRNLMQYGAAIAAVLSILAGSGGIFAVANALRMEGGSLPFWAWIILGVITVVGIAALFLLLILLFFSFLRRKEAEADAVRERGNLIAQDHTRFLPTSQQP